MAVNSLISFGGIFFWELAKLALIVGAVLAAVASICIMLLYLLMFVSAVPVLSLGFITAIFTWLGALISTEISAVAFAVAIGATVIAGIFKAAEQLLELIDSEPQSVQTKIIDSNHFFATDERGPREMDHEKLDNQIDLIGAIA